MWNRLNENIKLALWYYQRRIRYSRFGEFDYDQGEQILVLVDERQFHPVIGMQEAWPQLQYLVSVTIEEIKEALNIIGKSKEVK